MQKSARNSSPNEQLARFNRVPEPASLLLLGFGLIGAMRTLRRKAPFA